LEYDLTINIDILAYLFLILSCFYFILLVAVNIVLNRINNPQGKQWFSISIVIAARDEEGRILPCLESLENLDYPEDKYEIIFIDDHSSDNTAELIGSFCKKYTNWKIIRLNEKSTQLRGKKNALQKGIAQANGEIIFTTDADCVVPPNWLQIMSGYFKPGVSMVLGYSPLIYSKKWYFKLLQFDNLFSAIASAATAKLGYPFTSVGRNMAYRKDAYNNVGGFLSLKKFRSGDDIHLTGRFRYNDDGFIDFCAKEETFVKTHIPSTGVEVLQQQIRKNSKTFQLSGLSILIMVMILIYYSLLISIPIIVPTWRTIWIVILVIKFLLEYLPLRKATNIFKQKNLIPIIPIMQIIYPFYIIGFSIIGTFQFYHWKK
jgi:cellulose synthase/poly-beta-1,6-N-acetylglucosamine synthase-like glycosyltransferase